MLHGRPSFFEQRRALPVFLQRDEIVGAVRSSGAVVLVGETGSGKTTQVPQYLYHAGLAGDGLIAVTQPRRVAAITVSQRVAQEMGERLGGVVGYCIRFSDVTSAETVVKFVTDGMLLREAQLDPLLKRYSVVILDEAHERTLDTDILFAVVKLAMQRRPDLKVVVMSATLDTELFREYFSAAVVTVPGRQHPVDVYYTAEPETDYLDGTVVAIVQVHTDEPDGDILVFLPGQEEIESVAAIITERSRKLPVELKKLQVCQLFASMPPEAQLLAFEPAFEGHRKVILATNIAETAVTINGVKYVIDPGLAKVRAFHPITGMESLRVETIAKAQAWQRCGRAGREGPGKCFRLFMEDSFEKMATNSIPEVQRVSLATVCLRLLAMGVTELPAFPFLSPPTQASLLKAIELLINLGAVSSSGSLTPLGHRMSALPVEPRLASLLLKSEAMACAADMIDIVAMLGGDNVFFNPKDQLARAAAARAPLVCSDSDHVTLLNVLRGFIASGQSVDWCKEHYLNRRALKTAMEIREQLRTVCASLGMKLLSTAGWTDDIAAASGEVPPVNSEAIRRAMVAGGFLNIARRTPSPEGTAVVEYETLVGHYKVAIHPSSVLFRKKTITAVVFSDVIVTTKNYMRTVSAVEMAWLPEMAPHMFGRAKAAAPTAADTAPAVVVSSAALPTPSVKMSAKKRGRP